MATTDNQKIIALEQFAKYLQLKIRHDSLCGQDEKNKKYSFCYHCYTIIDLDFGDYVNCMVQTGGCDDNHMRCLPCWGKMKQCEICTDSGTCEICCDCTSK